uniref:C-type lectin domain-containing protein n=1 Tax=Plectus sambesii TaxID=2011161 RepID=A0A914XNV6_9BILA
MGGWCFYYYRNSSWPNNVPTQNAAQTMCGPKGNLAVGVTYKMLETYKTKYTSASQLVAWIALVRNAASASGWEWKTLLPNGNYTTFPAIMANLPWGSGEPGNDPVENAGWVGNNRGVCDVNGDMTGYGGAPMAIICQFAPQKWTYTQRGYGLFTNAAYRIAQMTA